MAHPASLGRGLTRDESNDRFFKVLLYISRRLFLGSATDLANENDRFGTGVVVEKLQYVDLVGPDYRVTADSDAS